ncbi:asparaginase domain-containing protein [Nocardioides baekrokdamisoli]|uniref:asparaginase domain-containing protein n=1 Tax=Nocardioides baekrokdamisoli TaxID=1804624 RepID=UPI000F7BAE11|nr:asparaginase domain-containing protein [Nocardioides baekrokdamisoli]
MTVRIVTTGGTIDKFYSARGEMEIDEPAVVELLAIGNNAVDVVVESVVAKDSLDFDDADRARILEAVRTAPERCILITHGTDTLTETGALLDAADLGGRTVVLTGAMQPAAMKESDAAFNLGAGLMAAQLAPAGVWIAMNGRVLPARDAIKDRSVGRFVLNPEH